MSAPINTTLKLIFVLKNFYESYVSQIQIGITPLEIISILDKIMSKKSSSRFWVLMRNSIGVKFLGNFRILS